VAWGRGRGARRLGRLKPEVRRCSRVAGTGARAALASQQPRGPRGWGPAAAEASGAPVDRRLSALRVGRPSRDHRSLAAAVARRMSPAASLLLRCRAGGAGASAQGVRSDFAPRELPAAARAGSWPVERAFLAELLPRGGVASSLEGRSVGVKIEAAAAGIRPRGLPLQLHGGSLCARVVASRGSSTGRARVPHSCRDSKLVCARPRRRSRRARARRCAPVLRLQAYACGVPELGARRGAPTMWWPAGEEVRTNSRHSEATRRRPSPPRAV
jgi:hypothetical protein